MTAITCKMCGRSLVVPPGATVAKCEACGSPQTVPGTDNERLLDLFAQANALRQDCKFDKAARVYKTISDDAPEEAEAYWGLLLCKHGIVYADDPATGKKVPTCHRPSFDSLLEDRYFDRVWESADGQAMAVYLKERDQLEELRKGILADAARANQYDVFLCCKELDQNGNRTEDSLLAQEVYDLLVAMGCRVFFPRVALADTREEEREPHVFAALNSAKILLLFDTGRQSYQDVWVKNEWRRYRNLMASDKTRHLILCLRNVEPDALPKSLSGFPIQDMGRPDALRSLQRRLETLFSANANASQVRTQTMLAQCAPALREGRFAEVKTICQEVLERDPENREALRFLLLAQYQVTDQSALYARKEAPLYYESEFYQRLLPYASEDPRIRELKEEGERLAFEKHQQECYQQALQALGKQAYQEALSLLRQIPDYLDAQDHIAVCKKALFAQKQLKTYRAQVGDGKRYLSKRFQLEKPEEYNHYVRLRHQLLEIEDRYATAFLLLAWLIIPLCCLLISGFMMGNEALAASFGSFLGSVAVISVLVASFKSLRLRKLILTGWIVKIGIAFLALGLQLFVMTFLRERIPGILYGILTIFACGILIFQLRKLFAASSERKAVERRLNEMKNTTFRAYGDQVRQELANQYASVIGKENMIALEDINPRYWS